MTMNGDFRQYMIDNLRRNVCKVTFRKKDGDQRIMKCTLRSDLIEAADRVPKGVDNVADAAEKATQDENIIRVLDTEKGEWRGFIIANIEEFEVLV